MRTVLLSLLLLCQFVCSAEEITTEKARQDLAMVLGGATMGDHLSPEDSKLINDRVMKNGRFYNTVFHQLFSSETLTPQSFESNYFQNVLGLTSKTDPAGALANARVVKAELDKFLFVYDLVKDKDSLFATLKDTLELAQIKNLISQRRILVQWITKLEK